ncbi:beta transducin [Coemansia sp. RSA 2052]|nr:beta transducin [Coemansia sp. RSA 2052]
MVKAYLRYEARGVFGVIASPTGNAVFDHSGKLSITAALESVIVWDIKKGTQVARWSDGDNKAEVTCIARSPNGKDYAVGYADGSIRLFDLGGNTVRVVLSGHRGRVSALEFDGTGMVLASGARDTDMILWDVVGEVGLCRLRGHKDEITGMAFVAGPAGAASALHASSAGYIVSSSKDTLVKLWDLRGRHCVQTLATHRSEVWGLAASPDGRLLVTGTSDASLRVWTLDVAKLDRLGGEGGAAAGDWEAIAEYGAVQRASSDRVVGLRFHPSGQYLACASADKQIEVSLRVWNAQTGACVRTLDCGAAVCAAFLPGDQHVVVGTRDGRLELYDIPAAALVETFDAHDGAACAAIDVRGDGKGLVTGGADKCVKFWDFELVRGAARRRMTLAHVKTLKMADDVLAVKCSPDARLLAVALLDCTVKVFYADSLKLFLSLYGHRLPVASLDISSDSALLVTGSADKSVKLWGLDFGDCHRSILAHQEPVTAVRFVWGTHYFFSAGKDKLVQQWNGDNFQRIQRLDACHGDVWALAVAKHGNFVVASSQDRSIRVWEKTDEQLFVEEERERELEEMYDRGLEESLDRPEQPDDAEEAQRAGKPTMDTLKAGERIIDALDVADEERRKRAAYEDQRRRMPQRSLAAPEPSPILQFERIAAEAYVLRTVERVRPADLDDALLALPFAHVLSLLAYVDHWARKEWNTALTCRVLFFLLRTHQNQIVATRSMRAQLASIRAHLRAGVRAQRDHVGYNLAALQSLRADWEASATAEFFDESDIQAVLDAQLKKRKFTGLKA